ncbi:MAG: RNA polymerase sigma-54 factor [Bacteroidetes bacterium]|nr:MAG: RNA polymerase sigma-54 factor [Bacteroidota bacterium]
MLKQNQQLKLLQKISPQQIQFIKLLQVPTASLEQRIKEEIEKNPALEDDQMGFGEEKNGEYEELDQKDDAEEQEDQIAQELSLDEYLTNDSYDYRTRLPQGGDDEEDEYEAPIVQMKSLYDQLSDQLALLDLSEKERIIGEHLIGSIDEDGYLRRPLKAIVHDMAFRYNLSTTEEEIESVLKKIQRFDPPGIGARNLQECLALQLRRKEDSKLVRLAITVIEKYFEEFKKKHFSKLRSRLGISEEELKQAYEMITKLNPKPGESQSVIKHEYIIPDFILTTENGQINIRLNSRNAPDLKISRNYVNMYQQYRGMDKGARKNPKNKEAMDFLKQRIEAAQWFIDAIRQRQFTLLNTMQAIADKQKEFFLSGGDEKKLKPMILKDIAEEIQMDISTVSRVANSKYVQTDFGIYPLKFFFTEGIETEDGMVSNREVKKALEEIINNESKRKPLSDDKIAALLKEKGYNIARRTVAKYREQLGVPVARLRKEV